MSGPPSRRPSKWPHFLILTTKPRKWKAEILGIPTRVRVARSCFMLFTFIIYFVIYQMPQAHGGLGLFDGIGKRRSCLG